MTFKIGDVAVYPAHGVGVIESVESRNISGTEHSFLMMRILDNDMTIMIPTENVSRVGLRKVIAPDKVEEIYEIMDDSEVQIDSKTWNKRVREYTEKIKTGSHIDAAEVLRDLMALKNGKGLSFGERKMLDNVRNLLSREIAVATNGSVADVQARLTRAFDN